MTERKQLPEKLWASDSPLVVEVAGDSMSPSLQRGWRVRVEPVSAEVCAGDILLLDFGGPRPVLHRAVHLFTREGAPFVIQRGDAGGPLTVSHLGSVVGRATAILSPSETKMPSVERLPPAVGRRFRRAGRWARLYARLSVRWPRRRAFFDRALSLAGRKVLAVSSTVRFELDLTRAPDAPPLKSPDVGIREIPRDAVEETLGTSRLPAQTLEELDAVAPAGWRCFAALSGGEAVHSSFVDLREGRPHLFRVRTVPSERGKGVFSLVVRTIALRLASEGYSKLTSSSGGSNRASRRAHAAAGFVETRRRIELRFLGLTPGRVLTLLNPFRRRG